MFKTSLITIIAAVASIGVTTSTHAATANDNGSFKVSTAGLNLQSVSGGKMMLGRIAAASKSACGSAPVIADLSGTNAWNTCVSDNVRQAVRQINAPSVSVAYSQPVDQALASNTSSH